MAVFFGSALQEARVQKRVHVEQELIYRNQLYEKILGSGSDGLLAARKAVKSADDRDRQENGRVSAFCPELPTGSQV
jgi:hypothetical protein